MSAIERSFHRALGDVHRAGPQARVSVEANDRVVPFQLIRAIQEENGLAMLARTTGLGQDCRMRMFKLAALMAMVATGASAADVGVETLAPAFTGTIVSIYPDGRISKLWLNRDGTFSSEGRKHEVQAGRWRVKAHSICLSQLKPVPIPFLSYCAAIPDTGVNASWPGEAVTVEPITIHLVPSRPAPLPG